LSKFACQSKRFAIAVALDLVQHLQALNVCRRIVVLAEKPQTARAILVDEPIDVLASRLGAFGLAAVDH
jgi:hypothetical protein